MEEHVDYKVCEGKILVARDKQRGHTAPAS